MKILVNFDVSKFRSCSDEPNLLQKNFSANSAILF